MPAYPGSVTGLRGLAVADDESIPAVLDDLTSALGQGRPLISYAADAAVPRQPGIAGSDVVEGVDMSEVPEGVALVVGTSGSTGPAKLAMLTRDNLVSSATATHETLGGPGSWLLAMPAHHIAGLQVLVRSIVAGTTPAVMDLGGGFSAAGFVEAAHRHTAAVGDTRRYTALVPTQLTRLLDDPAARDALAAYDAVLVGGAATSATTVLAAETAGVPIVRTYGMSETAGGCVYDGVPLSVSSVHIDNEQHVVLGGDTVALGYLGDPRLTADAFSVDADGTRWFRTDDLGVLDEAGLLQIRGRADDLINTGGLKVAPGTVEDAIVRYVPGVVDAVVVGTPHPSWGQAVSAALTMRPGSPALTVRDLRASLRGIVPDHALPQRLLVLDAIPQRGPGKPDRRALALAFDETIAAVGLP